MARDWIVKMLMARRGVPGISEGRAGFAPSGPLKPIPGVRTGFGRPVMQRDWNYMPGAPVESRGVSGGLPLSSLPLAAWDSPLFSAPPGSTPGSAPIALPAPATLPFEGEEAPGVEGAPGVDVGLPPPGSSVIETGAPGGAWPLEGPGGWTATDPFVGSTSEEDLMRRTRILEDMMIDMLSRRAYPEMGVVWKKR